MYIQNELFLENHHMMNEEIGFIPRRTIFVDDPSTLTMIGHSMFFFWFLRGLFVFCTQMEQFISLQKRIQLM